MNTQNSTITKLAETALMAALCYVSFTFLQIKIPVPGGDATSIHIGNAFCVLAALLIGGVEVTWISESSSAEQLLCS